MEAGDVGKIYKIRIGHDGTGIGDGWFLESITIKHLASKSKETEKKKKKKKKKPTEDEEDKEPKEEKVMQVYDFTVQRWLASDEGDKELVVELIPNEGSELEGKTGVVCFQMFYEIW